MKNKLITLPILKALAGHTAFERGDAYFSNGAVKRLRTKDASVTAQVEGGSNYQVGLCEKNGKLDYNCSCPRAADGTFCKHCVALGLAWLAENSSASDTKKKQDPWGDISGYLDRQSPTTLIDLLLDVAQRDDRLYRSLLLQAERAGGGGHLSPAYRKAIEGVTQIRGFIDWSETSGVAGDIDEVVDSLEELLKPDTAPTLVELVEYAVERVESLLEQADDSNGAVGGVAARLGELHKNACDMARPDPKALAERLFRLTTTLPIGVCSFDPLVYRGPLGKEGLLRYRELAEVEWIKFEKHGDKDGFDSQRYAIKHIMECLAKANGDIDELVAIKACGLASAHGYLEIAEIWNKAGQEKKSLEWAERGLKAFPVKTDNRLRDFLVEAYLKLKRNDEALSLTWIQFEERPSLDQYKKLSQVATTLKRWAPLREKALAWLAGPATIGKKKTAAQDMSRRLEIALWEKDLEAGLEAANKGSCERRLLIELAGKLEQTKPADAINLYRRVVPAIVEQTGNAAYEEAAKLIRRVGALMKTLKQTPQFTVYLAELRATFKPKRNFIKLLEGM